MKKRNLFSVLFLLIVSSVVGLVIAELVFRKIAPEYLEFQSAFIPSDTTIITLKPNIKEKFIHPANQEPPFFMSTNSLGLRSDREISFQVPENTKRILCLGDSYTFGFGVGNQETYPFYLEKKLNEESGSSHRYQVINAGFANGVATDAQYLYLKEQGIKFSPDVVTLGFCIANDFLDMANNEWLLGQNGELEKISNARSGKIPGFIKRTAIYVALKSHFLEKKVEKKKGVLISAEMMNRAKSLLIQMHTFGKKKRIKFVLILIPPVKLLNKDKEINDEKIKQELVSFCQENKIPYIDLTNNMNLSHIFHERVHFNKEGNHLVADAIYRKLIEIGYINSEL